MSTTSPKTWRHLALVRDGSRVQVYLDGALDLEGSASELRMSFAAFEGRLDELALYARALPVEELRSHARAR